MLQNGRARSASAFLAKQSLWDLICKNLIVFLAKNVLLLCVLNRAFVVVDCFSFLLLFGVVVVVCH